MTVRFLFLPDAAYLILNPPGISIDPDENYPDAERENNVWRPSGASTMN